MVGERRNRKRYFGGLGVGWDYKGQDWLGVEVKKGGQDRKVRIAFFRAIFPFTPSQKTQTLES